MVKHRLFRLLCNNIVKYVDWIYLYPWIFPRFVKRKSFPRISALQKSNLICPKHCIWRTQAALRGSKVYQSSGAFPDLLQSRSSLSEFGFALLLSPLRTLRRFHPSAACCVGNGGRMPLLLSFRRVEGPSFISRSVRFIFRPGEQRKPREKGGRAWLAYLSQRNETKDILVAENFPATAPGSHSNRWILVLWTHKKPILVSLVQLPLEPRKELLAVDQCCLDIVRLHSHSAY